MKKEEFFRNKGSNIEKPKLANLLARIDENTAEIKPKTSKNTCSIGENDNMFMDDSDIGESTYKIFLFS